MIKYKLICKDCNTKFDSWFASSNEYEKLKKRKFLTCHSCNSLKVEKTLMTPQLINSKTKSETKFNTSKYQKIKKTIKNYQKFIKDNFKYVGDNFAYEARSIHYNNKPYPKANAIINPKKNNGYLEYVYLNPQGNSPVLSLSYDQLHESYQWLRSLIERHREVSREE